MIGAGDAAASLISPELYREFALPYEQKVNRAVHDCDGFLKLHICGNTSHILQDMVKSGADLFNVDHIVDFDESMRIYTGAGKSFKGNLDPVAGMLRSTPEACAAEADRLVRRAQGTRFILSPGCEVPTDVPDDVLWAFCGSVL